MHARAVAALAEQDGQIPGVSDKREDVTDEVLTLGIRPRHSAGFDLCDVAVIDQVFADSEWDLAAPFGERPSPVAAR